MKIKDVFGVVAAGLGACLLVLVLLLKIVAGLCLTALPIVGLYVLLNWSGACGSNDTPPVRGVISSKNVDGGPR